jgi:hypothetical protein
MKKCCAGCILSHFIKLIIREQKLQHASTIHLDQVVVQLSRRFPEMVVQFERFFPSNLQYPTMGIDCITQRVADKMMMIVVAGIFN